MTIIGEITVRPEEFAAAVGWVAKWVESKPVIPIHGGIAIDADSTGITLTAFGENHTVRAKVAAEGLCGAEGRTVVSGRLLASLAATFGKGKAVGITADGGAVRLTHGRWTGELPAMDERDWSTLPGVLPAVGDVAGDELATAVERAGIARGTDPASGAALTMMHLEIIGDRLELMTTNRYRVSTTSIAFSSSPNITTPSTHVRFTPLAEAMVNAAAAFAGPERVTLGADGGGSLSLTGARRQIVMRLGSLAEPWPAEAMRAFFTKAMAFVNEIEIETATIAAPLKRAGIIGGKGGLASISIADGVLSIGGADDTSRSSGTEEIEVEYDGEPASAWFNASYFGDAFATAPGKVVRLRFETSPVIRMPAVVTCDDDPHWRYLTMPVRKV